MRRSILVNRTHPISSSAVDKVRVSLFCEPWLQPDPVVEKRVIPQPKDPVTAVLAAVMAGNSRFVDITMTAFGSQSGSAQQKARTALAKLKADGVLNSQHQPGKATQWNCVKSC